MLKRLATTSILISLIQLVTPGLAEGFWWSNSPPSIPSFEHIVDDEDDFSPETSLSNRELVQLLYALKDSENISESVGSYNSEMLESAILSLGANRNCHELSSIRIMASGKARVAASHVMYNSNVETVDALFEQATGLQRLFPSSFRYQLELDGDLQRAVEDIGADLDTWISPSNELTWIIEIYRPLSLYPSQAHWMASRWKQNKAGVITPSGRRAEISYSNANRLAPIEQIVQELKGKFEKEDSTLIVTFHPYRSDVEPMFDNKAPRESSIEDADSAPYLQRLLDLHPVKSNWLVGHQHKVLLHVLGDAFGKDSDLEGAPGALIWEHVLDQISTMLKIRSMVDTQGHIIPKEELLRLSKEIETGITVRKGLDSKSLRTFHRSYRDAINNMQQDGSVAIPFGWDEHAMTLEIKRDAANSYSVRIYNTGDGIAMHPRLKDAIERTLVPFVEFPDVDPNALLQAPVLQNLIDLQGAPPSARKWGPTDVYAPIARALNRAPSHLVIPVDRLIAPQASGTCAYQSILAWFSQRMNSSKSFRRLTWELQLKTLWDYYQIQNKIGWSEELPRRLFDKSLTLFSNNTLQLYKESLLTDDELMFVKSRISEMKDDWQNGYNQHYLRDQAKRDILPELVRSRHRPQQLTREQYVDTIWAGLPEKTPTPKSYSPKLEYINTDAWPPSPHALADALEHIVDEINIANQQKNYRTVQTAIVNISAALPLGNDALSYWQQLHASDAERCLESLAKLSVAFLQSHLIAAPIDHTQSAALSAIHYLAQAKLLTIANIIAQLHPDAFGGSFPVIKTTKLLTILDSSSSLLQIENPLWDKQAALLREYYLNEAQGPVEDFFSFQLHNAGSTTSHLMWFHKWWRTVPEDDSKLSQHHGDVEWVKRWMQTEEAIEAITARYPDILAEEINYQAIFLMTDQKWAYDWKKEYHLKGTDARPFQEANCKLDNAIFSKSGRVDFLPKAFISLRDIAFVTDYLLTGRLASDAVSSLELDFDKGIEYPALRRKDYSVNLVPQHTWELGYSLFGTPSFQRPRDAPSKYTDYPETDEMVCGKGICPHDHLSRYKHKIRDDGLRKFFESEDHWRQRFAENNLMRRYNYDAHEVMQEGLRLSSDPHMQIRATLGLFNQHPRLAAIPAYRDLLTALLLDRQILAQEYLRHPDDAQALTEELAAFCQSQHDTAERQGDLIGSVFYLNLSSLLNAYQNFLADEYLEQLGHLHDSAERQGNSIGSVFYHILNSLINTYQNFLADEYPEQLGHLHSVNAWIDSRSKLKAMLENSSLSASERALVARDLVRTYRIKPELSNSDVSTLVVAQAIHQAAKLPDGTYEYGAHDETFTILRNLVPQMQVVLETDKETVLNTIFKTLYPNHPSVSWDDDSVFPFYTGHFDEHEVIINILNGYVWCGGELVELPAHISTNALFTTHIKSTAQSLVTLVGDGVYEFADKEANLFRIFSKEDCIARSADVDSCNLKHALVVHRFIEGRWYELLPPEILSMDAGVTIKNSSHLEEDTLRNLWLGLSGGSAQRETFTQWAPTMFHHVWLRQDSKELLLTDPTTRNPVYTAEASNFSAYPNLIEVSSIKPYRDNSTLSLHRLDTTQDHTTFMDSDTLGWIGRIEYPQYSSVWVNESSSIAELIEIPRLGLEFTATYDVNGGFRYKCSRFPGYYLADGQNLPQLETFSQYLVLETDSSHTALDKLIVMPRIRPVRLPVSNLDTHALPGLKDPPTKLVPSASIDILTYSIDSVTGALVPHSDAGRYFLALAMLWEHRYDQAIELLRGHEEHMGPLGDDAVEVLLWIIDSIENPQRAQIPATLVNADPRAFAVVEQAYFIVARDELFHDSSDRFDSKGYRDLKDSLAKFQSMIPSRLSSTDSQKALIEAFRDSIARDDSSRRTVSSEEYLAPKVSRLQFDNLMQFGFSIRRDVLYSKDIPYTLRSTLFKHFQDMYRISKGAATPTQISDTLFNAFSVYHDVLTGSVFDLRNYGTILSSVFSALTSDTTLTDITQDLLDTESTYQETLIQSYRLALQMIEHVGDKTQAAVARLLRIIDRYPDMFPSADETDKYFTQVLDPKWNSDEEKEAVEFLLERIASTADTLATKFEMEEEQTFTPDTQKVTATIEGRLEHMYTVDMPQIQRPDACPLSNNYSILNRALFRNLSDIIEVVESPNDESRYGSELARIFDVATEDSFVSSRFKELSSSVSDYLSTSSAKREYRLRDEEKLVKHLNLVKVLEAQAREDHEVTLKHIMELATTQSRNFLLRSYEGLEQASGLTRSASLDDLIFAYTTQDLNAFSELNPNIDAETAFDLVEMLQIYLAQSTRQQYYNRILRVGEALTRALGNEADIETIQLHLENLYKSSTALRHYDPVDHPQYMVFEYYMDILLRKEQVANLDRLAIEQGDVCQVGAVLESVMGSGKTTVLLPLLAYMVVKSEHVPLLIMPQELVPSLSRELEKRIGKVFHYPIDVLDITRAWPHSTENVRTLRERIVGAKDAKRVLVMSHSSFQSMWLHFVSALADASDGHRKAIDELSYYRDIFTFLKHEAHVIIDELDTVFDVQRSYHFAKGDPTSIHPHVLDATTELYRLLATDAELQQVVALPFAQDSIDGHAFTPDHYFAHVRPLLAEKLVSREAFIEDLNYQSFLRHLSPKQTEDLNKYLLDEEERFAIPDIAALNGTEIKNFISVLKEQLTRLLPLTIGKQLYTHYGPRSSDEMSSSRFDYAIPYHLGRPSHQSLFGTDLETTNYTLQMLLEKGLSEEIVDIKLRILQGQVKAEMNDMDVDEEVPSLEEFYELSGGTLTALDLNRLTPSVVETVCEHVNSRKELQLRLIREMILPKIPTFTRELNSTAQTYGVLFDSIQGFSGTLWNIPTYPSVFDAKYPSDTRPRTLDILWSHSPHSVGVIASADLRQTVYDRVNALFDNATIPASSLIDTSGIFRDVVNEDVARAMLERANHSEDPWLGVIFYNEAGLPEVIQQGLPDPVLLSECQLSPEQLVAYWDQQHTTGADLKVGADAVAIVTVGRHTIMRDLLQSVWRLRQLHRQQRVVFVAAEEDADAITEVLGKLHHDVSSDSMSLEYILVYCEYQQILQQGKQNARALPHKLHGLMINLALPTLLDQEVNSHEQLLSLYDSVRHLFETEHSQEPHQLYGQSHSLLASEDLVYQQLESWLMHPLLTGAGSMAIPSERIDAIRTEMQNTVQALLPQLPDFIESPQSYENEVSMDLNTNMEQQQEKEQEQEQEQETFRTHWYGNPIWGARPRITWHPITNRDTIELSQIPAGDVKELSDCDRESTLIDCPDQPVAGLKDLLHEDPYSHTDKLMPAISTRILTSINFVQMFDPGSKDVAYYSHFRSRQKQISHLLILSDTDGKDFDIVLIDTDDAVWWDSEIIRLRRQQSKVKESERRQVALYQLDTGIYRRLNQDWDFNPLLDNPEFKNAMVQIKFLGGRVRYSKNELSALRDWLEAFDIDEIHEWWQEERLRELERTQEEVPNSAMDRLFRELKNAKRAA